MARYENASHVSVVESSLANEQLAIVVLINRKLCDVDNISTRLELPPTHIANPFLRSIIHGATHLLLTIHDRLCDCDVLHICGIAMALVAGQCGKDKNSKKIF